MQLSLQESDLNFTAIFQVFQQPVCNVLLLPGVTMPRDLEVKGRLRSQMFRGAQQNTQGWQESGCMTLPLSLKNSFLLFPSNSCPFVFYLKPRFKQKTLKCSCCLLSCGFTFSVGIWFWKRPRNNHCLV